MCKYVSLRIYALLEGSSGRVPSQNDTIQLIFSGAWICIHVSVCMCMCGHVPLPECSAARVLAKNDAIRLVQTDGRCINNLVGKPEYEN
jgi:hypothetical protein